MLKLVIVSKIMALFGVRSISGGGDNKDKDDDNKKQRPVAGRSIEVDVVTLLFSVVVATSLVVLLLVGKVPTTSTSTTIINNVVPGFLHRRTYHYNDPDNFPWKSMHRTLLSSSASSVRHHDNNDDDGGSSTSPFFDNSVFYTKLRQSYDTYFPKNDRRSLQVVEKLQSVHLDAHPVPSSSRSSSSSSSSSSRDSSYNNDRHEYYDVHNCPDTPPVGYPYEWKLWDDLLTSWPADDMEHPKSGMVYNGLCIFDYRKDFDKATRYRDAEVPFVVRGDPDVARTVERWNQQHYLSALFGDIKMQTEYSETSQFMYWNTRHTSRKTIEETKWTAPTKELEMTYEEWLKVANLTDDALLGPDKPHHYFKVTGPSGTATRSAKHDDHPGVFLADELPFYTQAHSSLYIKDNDKINGKPINCRFGMKGVIAANHFDGERNFVTVFQGERRYILSSPPQIKNLALYPRNHPSARHSMVDYTHPDFDEFPEFANARATEVVLQPGDSLFVPTVWFHFIVSLSLNIQCNSRSGMVMKYNDEFAKFGYA